MKTQLGYCCALLTLFAATAWAESPAAMSSLRPAQGDISKVEGLYVGPWVTTNPKKKLNGTSNCEVKQLAPARWQARFWGVWQQVPFDYTVDFTGGPVESSSPAAAAQSSDATTYSVTGTALIDGASYEWSGTLSPREFLIQYGGSRYEGHLELSRIQ